jgi:AAA15 family ATPase/GTPase
MSKAPDQISIQEYLSIREQKDFNFGKLNVLVGNERTGNCNSPK